MLTANIGVLVSGGGTNLQAIIDAQKAGQITSGKVALVASNNKDAFALQRARQSNIAASIFTSEGELQQLLNEYHIDLLVLAGFLSILSKDFIEQFDGKIINIHPSLIPSFCGNGYYGIHVHEKALNYGVKVTGATVHYVNEIPDGGQIIAQKAVEIKDNDTPESLQKRVMEQAEWILLPKTVELVCKKIVDNSF